MKKGTKLTDTQYFLEVRYLSHKPIHLSSGPSLRELVRVATEHVPTMDTYSKVYREMRIQLGVYMGIFVVVVANNKPFHALVTITSDTVSQADYDRFHAFAATLPKAPLSFKEASPKSGSTS